MRAPENSTRHRAYFVRSKPAFPAAAFAKGSPFARGPPPRNDSRAHDRSPREIPPPHRRRRASSDQNSPLLQSPIYVSFVSALRTTPFAVPKRAGQEQIEAHAVRKQDLAYRAWWGRAEAEKCADDTGKLEGMPGQASVAIASLGKGGVR
jgi:hypothetical protein